MRIIISPAKQMLEDTDTIEYRDLPIFLNKTEIIKDSIRNMTYEQQKKIWACNDKIASQNRERFSSMDLHKHLSPALLSYDGIQYTYMAPSVFEKSYFDYVQKHLRILSGFYGILKPLDGIVPYRLEMQAKIQISGTKNLYDFWGDDLYKETVPEDKTIINLASKEYSKCIEKHLKPEDRFITVIFGTIVNGKIVQKGVYAKMARGEMVRFAAEKNIEDPEDLKNFSGGYVFDETRSSNNKYVFISTKN